MSWLDKLNETYDNCSSLIGKVEANGKTPLLPIAHSTQNAQIEVTIDTSGKFVGAVKISDKKDAITIIPVTEDSASRSSGITPHPLCDKLIYTAGDYCNYVDGKRAEEYYKEYITKLENWCSSDYSHKKITAVLAYLKKKSLIADLVEQRVLICREDGKLDASIKLEAGSQCDAFVRFKIVEAGDPESCVWLDEGVRHSHVHYYLGLQNKKVMCYVSGELKYCSEKHPSKIRNTADKAKLISGNDNSGFTYRGKFSDKGQVVNVGYDISQKAHNALKWLIEKQGYRNDEQSIIAWGTRNEKLPSLFDDTFDFLSDEENRIPPSTYDDFARRLKLAITGYKCDLDSKSDIVIMAVEAATTGRLSITYYKELNGFELLDRIENWHNTCIWRHSYRSIKDEPDEKGRFKFRLVTFIGAPSPKDIALAAYGQNASSKLVKATVERLLPCIIDKLNIPFDLVNAVVNRAKNPVSMDEFNRRRAWGIACALVKKYRETRYKEVWSMELEKTNMDVHYLCGRLLAVADEIESWALKEMREDRDTNAIRLFERYAQNPVKTWGIIDKRLIPYQRKLGKKCEWLLDIREDVSHMLDMKFDDFVNARNLDGRFILGYDCQKKEIRDEILRRKESKASLSKADASSVDASQE